MSDITQWVISWSFVLILSTSFLVWRTSYKEKALNILLITVFVVMCVYTIACIVAGRII